MADLGESQNARLREAMKKLMRERFDDNQTKLADALGISQPSVNKIIGPNPGGASQATAEKFAALVGKDVREIIGPRDAPLPQRTERDAAIEAARQLGYHDDAIDRTIAEEGDAPGRDRHWWFAHIQSTHIRMFAEMRARSPLGRKQGARRRKSTSAPASERAAPSSKRKAGNE